MPTPPVTLQERQETLAFWRRHEAALQADNLCDEEAMRWLHIYTQPDNIGYEFGMLRPGKMGQWDLYDLTMEMLSQDQRLLISGLSASEVAASDRDMAYGLDPRSATYQNEVAEVERLEAMSPNELDREIARLEALVL
jgi:hypothetical protein